jgi:hypothetical protein
LRILLAMRMRPVVFLLSALSLFSPAAFAQGTYVSASVVGDISRFSRAASDTSPDFSGSGEAIGFALRLGTPIGANWGVEAEFARPSEVRQEGQPDFALDYDFYTIVPPLGIPTIPVDQLLFGYGLKTWQRTTTFSTNAWVRQEFSNRVSLVYLGGLAFARTVRRSELTFLQLPIPVFPGIPPRAPILPPSQSTEFVQYGAHPLVGAEARIGLTGQVELVPGVRLLGLDNGWLLRPSVGLGWTF